MQHLKRILIIGFFGLYWSNLLCQQVSDTSYDPVIHSPMYQPGTGPTVFIDEGHYNFHTKDGRYAPFAKILEKDGYQVRSYKGEFIEEYLHKGKILVIANAINKANVDDWSLPTPSAFTKEEIETLKNWVANGGRLFLIADHMPWPGANEALASAFGFTFYNGFNIDVVNPAYFRKSNGTIPDNVITRGRDSTEAVSQIPRTEGQAFQIPPDAHPILLFSDSCLILLPDTAWEFNSSTPLKNINGWSQGAFKTYGKGKVVVFGEASMFSAQIGDDNRKMGMNSIGAEDNHKLLLNIIHWLDDKIQ
ncbi:MAG TPA: DUF4350 domain-containing protein [Flavobacteriaceae bacterium]|jgi:hypothetical protein|nr:DUF4350 domain-containing protein [Flavobacteriaceae bacterium]